MGKRSPRKIENLTAEEKEKKHLYHCELNKNLSEEQSRN